MAAADISRAVVVLGRLKLQARIENMRRGNVTYVMPSLRGCGGLALLVTMAIGLPSSRATGWDLLHATASDGQARYPPRLW